MSGPAAVPATLLALLAAGAPAAGRLEGQARGQRPGRCQLSLERVDRKGTRVEVTPGVVNNFAGGNVHVKCLGARIDMYADSVAMFGNDIAQFIGNVRYRDSVTAVDANFGQYNKLPTDEYFDAQGNVTHRDLKTGSTIAGNHVVYYRPIRNRRPDGEVIADQRPTVRYVIQDSLGQPGEPYVIVGDRVRLAGSDVISASGRVTIDRSDLQARSDSMWIDSGERSAGQLVGGARLKGLGRDSFALEGGSIDLRLESKALAGLKARDSARLEGRDVNLVADSLQIDLAGRDVERVTAWGDTVRPVALAAEYEARGDSLVIETPARKLEALRAYGKGWIGLRADSTASERDWIGGDLVLVQFAERDSAGVKKTAVREVLAEREARSFYRVAPQRAGGIPSYNYTRADRIVVTMRITADSNAVERVTADGKVDGVHLQPAVARADSVRRDTTGTRPVPEGPR
jgi:hypothetical protein